MEKEIHFIRRVKKEIKNRGLKYIFIAEEMEIHPTRLCQILRKHRSMNLKEREKLEKILF